MKQETLSVPEAARVAEVSTQTVRRWCKCGFVTAVRVAPERGAWRIDKAALLRKLGMTGKEG